MVMFLMVLSMTGLGVALMCIAFAAAARPEQPRIDAKPARTLVAQAAPPQFFVDSATAPLLQPRVPLEVLLLQIERHIRLEQAAAESFIASPTAASLHSRTTSPLVH